MEFEEVGEGVVRIFDPGHQISVITLGNRVSGVVGKRLT